MDNTELQQIPPSMPAYGDAATFEHAQRVAKMICSSSLVPEKYKGNVQNTMIAMEMANRMGASPLMVMQHLYIVKGSPSFSSTFIISAINTCGKFSPLRFDMRKDKDGIEVGCTAWALDKETGERIESPEVTMLMAKAEGWIDKAGSKWVTMPSLMLRYRAAAFFGRLYAPEITMGMQSAEEIADYTEVKQPLQPVVDYEELQTLYDFKKEALTPEERTNAERILSNLETNSYNKLHTLLKSK